MSDRPSAEDAFEVFDNMKAIEEAERALGCSVKDEPDSERCGKDTFTFLSVSYQFDTGETFNIRLGMCEDHYKTLLGRYRREMA